MFRRSLLMLILTLPAANRAAAQASAPPARECLCAANEEMLWLISAERDPKDKSVLNWLAFLDKISPQMRAAVIPPQRGTIVRAAVVGESLHVFYGDNAAHYRYSLRQSRREVRLPDSGMPLAIAGEVADQVPVLWAVVTGATAEQVATAWDRHLRDQATRPTSAAIPGPGRLSVGSRPSAVYHLVKYQGGFWQPGIPLPATCAESHQMWLCLDQGRQHVFWQKTAEDVEIQYAFHENQCWHNGPGLRLSRPPRGGFAVVMNKQLRFGAMEPVPDAGNILRCESFALQDLTSEGPARWNALPPCRQKSGQELTLPTGSVVCGFSDNLVFVRPGEAHTEFGLWRMMTGDPDQDFQEMPLHSTSGESEGRRSVRELTTTLVVAVLLVLVFWRRQESITRPTILPPGLVSVRPAKRALAAIIDATPAALIAWGIWWRDLTKLAHELQALTPADQPPETWPRELLVAWVVFMAIYTAYCCGFELMMGRTPGKMLLGCRVVSEALDRPNLVQVIIRNASRLLELEPHLLIWPFLLVIFLTPHRQRIGDLLARTIVVERAKGYAPPSDESSEDDEA